MSEIAPSQPKNGSLWVFAAALYSTPQVAEACLALQDRFGCDVNLLLFAAWMAGVRNQIVTPDQMKEAAFAVEDWSAQIVRPLRGVRRRLKSGPLPAPNAASDILRAGIKAIEIETERFELAILEELAAKWHAGSTHHNGGDAWANLKTALGVFVGTQLPPEALDLLRAIHKGIARMKPLASP